jgi:anthranilate phosphoribosyltransferase
MTADLPSLALRASIQKVATGPEYSKDLSLEEARSAMELILDGHADPVQAAVFLIALRMKRETDDENRGVLRAILNATQTVQAAVDEVVDIADPYDGFSRGLPASPFLPAVLAACGLPAVSHGLESVGPKHGLTHRRILRAAGVEVDLSPEAAAARVSDPDIGWAYVDQSHSCPRLHALVELRARMVKRPVITTVETLTGPIRGRSRTHLLTGYVHQAYPRIYALLAREAGFDSALILRGVEGGVVPSLQQAAGLTWYRDGGETRHDEIDPGALGIQRDTRAVPLPDAARDDGGTDAHAVAAAELGMAALRGREGPTRDSLVYAAALMLHRLGRFDGLPQAADAVRRVLDSGAAYARLTAG